jgi:hypothetical protein
MTRIDGDQLPMHIIEVYLFGSFLLDKIRPNDIDLLLVYSSDLTLRLYEAGGETPEAHWRMRDLRRSPARLRGCLKHNGELSVDISICSSIEEFQRDLVYPMPLYLQIWSRDDGNWRSKLFCHFSKHSTCGCQLELGCPV